MNIYPTSCTYELPINKEDYIRVNIDLNIDRNNIPERNKIKNSIINVLENIIKMYESI